MPNDQPYQSQSVDAAFSSIDTIRQLREQIRSQRAELADLEEKLKNERENHQKEREKRKQDYEKIKGARETTLTSWDAKISAQEKILAQRKTEQKRPSQSSPLTQKTHSALHSPSTESSALGLPTHIVFPTRNSLSLWPGSDAKASSRSSSSHTSRRGSKEDPQRRESIKHSQEMMSVLRQSADRILDRTSLLIEEARAVRNRRAQSGSSDVYPSIITTQQSNPSQLSSTTDMKAASTGGLNTSPHRLDVSHASLGSVLSSSTDVTTPTERSCRRWIMLADPDMMACNGRRIWDGREYDGDSLPDVLRRRLDKEIRLCPTEEEPLTRVYSVWERFAESVWSRSVPYVVAAAETLENTSNHNSIFSYSFRLVSGTVTSMIDYTFPEWLSRFNEYRKKQSIRSTTTLSRKYVVQSAEFYGADFSLSTSHALQDELLQLASQRKLLSEANADSATVAARQEQGTVFVNALNKMAANRPAGETSSIVVSTANSPLPSPKISKPSPPKLNVPENEQIDYSDVFPLDLITNHHGLLVFRIENLKPVLMPEILYGKFCVADCYLILKCNQESTTGGVEYHIWTWIGEQAEMDKRFCSAMFAVGLRNWIKANCRIERECEKEESAEFIALFDEYTFEYLDASHATESGLFVAEATRYPLRVYQAFGKKDFGIRLVEPTQKSLKEDAVFVIDWGLEIYQWNGSKSSLQHQIKCRMLADRINKSDRSSKATIVEMKQGEEPARFKEIMGFNLYDSTDDLGEQDDTDYQALGETTARLFQATEKQDYDVSALEILPTLKYPSPKRFGRSNSEGTSLVAVVGTLKQAASENSSLASLADTSIAYFSRELLCTESCFVLDCGVELYLWIGKGSSVSLRGSATEMLTKIVPLSPRPSWIGLHRIYEGHEPEVFKLRFPDWNSYGTVNWQVIKEGSVSMRDDLIVLGTEKALQSLDNDAKTSGIRVDVRALYAPATIIDPNVSFIKKTIRHANALLQNFSTFVYSDGNFVLLPDDERGHFWSGNAYVFLCVYRLEEEKERSKRMAESMDAGLGSGPKSNTESDSSVTSPIEVNVKSHEEEEEEAVFPSMECVVYFWQGRQAHRLAYSTFKFKTQTEMEKLMQEMYGCQVKVVYLDSGKEPIALLAHLNNMCIMHSKTRQEFVDDQLEEDKLAASLSQTALEGSERDHHVEANKNALLKAVKKSRQGIAYQIWTDLRYRTVRSAQIKPSTSALISKNCFLVFRRDFKYVFLWVGKNTSREDLLNAHRCAEKILAIWGHPQLVGRSGLIPERGSFTSMNPSQSDTPRASEYNKTSDLSQFESVADLLVIDEKEEPKTFWTLLEVGLPLTAVPSSYTPNTARFLRCHCTEGYFMVEEVLHYSQIDLKQDSCIILDPGKWSPCYIWMGNHCSDVVKKLTRKSVEVWLANLADGRGLGEITRVTFEHRKHEKKKSRSGPIGDHVYREGDVVWIQQGHELVQFCSYFMGWDHVGSGLIEPSSRFSQSSL